MEALRQRIEAAFEVRAEISPSTVEPSVRADVEKAINMLDTGEARVAEKIDGQWYVHQWLKKAVLLHFVSSIMVLSMEQKLSTSIKYQ